MIKPYKLLIKLLHWNVGPTKAWEHALRYVDVRMAEHLFELGASSKDVDASVAFNHLGFTICGEEQEQQWLAFLQYFLKAGFDVNKRDRHNDSLFGHMLNRGPTRSIVECMVEAGADLNVHHFSLSNTHPCVMAYKSLLAAHQNCQSNDQRSDDNNAYLENSKQIFLYLMSQKGAFNINELYNDHLMPAVIDTDVFKAVLDAGSPLVWNNWMGFRVGYPRSILYNKVTLPHQETVLFSLCNEAFEPHFEQCLEHLKTLGQDHSLLNPRGNFLFHCVSQHPTNDVASVAQLLNILQQHDYVLTHTNQHQETLWHVLFHKPTEGTKEWFDALTQTSALSVLHQQDNHGNTPLDVLDAWLSKNTEHANDLYECRAFIEQDLLHHAMPSKISKVKRKM